MDELEQIAGKLRTRGWFLTLGSVNGGWHCSSSCGLDVLRDPSLPRPISAIQTTAIEAVKDVERQIVKLCGY